jgi:hypothetical protein
MPPGLPVAHAPLGTADFFARARQRLTLDVPEGLFDPGVIPRHGDHDLNPDVISAIAAIRPIRPAAVLVPIIERAEPTILLTQRTAHLKDQTEEEVALDRRFVEPIGYLDIHMTTRGYRIVPTLARITGDFHLRLNRDEVDDAFEVPLAFLMAPENHKRDSRDWNGMTRTFYAMPFGERYIWGATAGILRNLYERIYQE